jgi:hypothetical protein
MVWTGLVCAIASWVVVDLGTHRWFGLVKVPWAVAAVLVGVSLVVIALGWPIHQFVKGKRKEVDRLRAATVLALGKACTLAGSALTGVYAAVAVECLRETGTPALRERVFQACAAALAALAMALAGRLVEWFCRLPPEEGDDAASRDPGGAEPSAA